MIKSRPNDSFAIGFAYTEISNQVTGFDIDSGLPVARNYEALLEICYTMQLTSGWTIQPDFQYFWQPGGNVPAGPTSQVRAAAHSGGTPEPRKAPPWCGHSGGTPKPRRGCFVA